MIAPLVAFSVVYTTRARALAAASPGRAPSSEAATGTTTPSQPERTPAPPLTGAVNALSEVSLLLAAQEGGKVGKSPPDLAKGERKAVTESKKRGQRAHTTAAGPYGKIGAYGKAADMVAAASAVVNGPAIQGLSLSV